MTWVTWGLIAAVILLWWEVVAILLTRRRWMGRGGFFETIAYKLADLERAVNELTERLDDLEGRLDDLEYGDRGPT